MEKIISGKNKFRNSERSVNFQILHQLYSKTDNNNILSQAASKTSEPIYSKETKRQFTIYTNTKNMNISENTIIKSYNNKTKTYRKWIYIIPEKCIIKYRYTDIVTDASIYIILDIRVRHTGLNIQKCLGEVCLFILVGKT